MNIHSQELASRSKLQEGFHGHVYLETNYGHYSHLSLATLLTFGMIHLSPVDPAEAYLSAAHIQSTDEILAQKRHEFGLDQPLHVQYVNSIIKICQFDFGISYLSNKPVWDEVTIECQRPFS